MKTSVSSVIVAVLLLGCGSSGGNEYVGSWVNSKYGKRTLVIERNGQSFIVRETHPSFIDGKPETKNIPATYKDGQLHIASGFGSVSLAIDEASGNLTDGKLEYKKAQ